VFIVISLSTQSGNFWIHRRIPVFLLEADYINFLTSRLLINDFITNVKRILYIIEVISKLEVRNCIYMFLLWTNRYWGMHFFFQALLNGPQTFTEIWS